MSADPPPPLSCYTENLSLYLLRERDDAAEHIARSVRLAIRTDLGRNLLAFSHHDPPLNVLPDGTVLEYASAIDWDDALDRMRHELRSSGRLLVMANLKHLPWGSQTSPEAPHLVLVTDVQGQWHVVDNFSALLTGGTQQPFSGWITPEQLQAAMTPIVDFRPEHLLRNELAFGEPVPPPQHNHYQWLERRLTTTRSPNTTPATGTWTRSTVESLNRLSAFFREHAGTSVAERHLDDIWAASRHHVFRTTVLWPEGTRANESVEAWTELPMKLLFCHNSAARGRPRDSLVASLFSRVVELETTMAAELRNPA